MTLIRALLRPKVIFLGFLAPAFAVADPTAMQIAEKSRTMERLAPQRYGALPCRFVEIREELNEKGMVEERETETRRIQAATAPDPGSRESQKITPDMHKQNSSEDSSILDHVELFDWNLEAEDDSQGEPCYRLAFRPQRGEKVLSGRGEVIARSAGRCWVAKSDFSKRRLEGRLTQPVEMRGAPYLNVMIKSVNQPIAADYFQFPLQGLLAAGLPVRRILSRVTDETSQIVDLMMANLFIRKALNSQDPQKAKQEIQRYCQGLNSEAGKQQLHQASEEAMNMYKKMSGDPQSWDKILSEITEEQWESIRLSEYTNLSSEDFAQKRMNPAFRKELADNIVAGLAKGAQKKDGQGVTPEETISGMIRGYKEAARRLDNIDLEALRAKDQKMAAQLRHAFQLEAISSK